ncbi:MAG: aminoacetone oxidase family FAD-binding enzyme, partial [Chrysiogenales bacterium]
LGHRVTEVGPALTAVAIQDYQFASLSRISFTDATISLIRANRKVRQHSGDLLFTHSGLSGPGILDFSRYIRPRDTLRISFLPGVDLQQAQAILLARIHASVNRQVRKILAAFDLPDRFVRKLLDLAGINQDQTGAHLSRDARLALLDLLTACPFVVSRLGGIAEAMVTRGGVALDEINPKTMESRLISGLFFIGEVLDIDGDSGGYNLQAAFSTAALAAKRISSLLI